MGILFIIGAGEIDLEEWESTGILTTNVKQIQHPQAPVFLNEEPEFSQRNKIAMSILGLSQFRHRWGLELNFFTHQAEPVRVTDEDIARIDGALRRFHSEFGDNCTAGWPTADDTYVNEEGRTVLYRADEYHRLCLETKIIPDLAYLQFFKFWVTYAVQHTAFPAAIAW